MQAISFGVELKFGLSFLDAFFTPAPGVVVDVVGFEQLGDRYFVSIASTSCDSSIQSIIDVDPSPIGTLHLTLEAGVPFRRIQFLEEATIAGELRRSTIVDDLRADHQPQIFVGDGARYVRGGANGSASHAVDIGDAIRVLSHLFPAPVSLPLFCRDAADANNDGKVDVADSITVLRYLFASGPLLQGPFPLCGADLDIDRIDLLCSQNSSFCCDGPVCP